MSSMLSKSVIGKFFQRITLVRAIACVSLMSVFLAQSPALAAQKIKCKSVKGLFESSILPPTQCSVSPPLLCTSGILEGDIEGSYEFVMDASTQIMPVVFFTGRSAIQTLYGDLISSFDMGSIDFSNSQFVTNISFTGATGRMAASTGRLVAIGLIDLAAGKTKGKYAGEVCGPKRGEDDDYGDYNDN